MQSRCILEGYRRRVRDVVRHEENALGRIEGDVDLVHLANESVDVGEGRSLEIGKSVLRERLVEQTLHVVVVVVVGRYRC